MDAERLAGQDIGSRVIRGDAHSAAARSGLSVSPQDQVSRCVADQNPSKRWVRLAAPRSQESAKPNHALFGLPTLSGVYTPLLEPEQLVLA